MMSFQIGPVAIGCNPFKIVKWSIKELISVLKGRRVDFSNFTSESREAIAGAQKLSIRGGHSECTPLHLAITLISNPSCGFKQAICDAADKTKTELAKRAFSQAMEELPKSSKSGNRRLSRSLVNLSRLAKARQKVDGSMEITLHDLILALLEDLQVAELLKKSGISIKLLKFAIASCKGEDNCASEDPKFHAHQTYWRDFIEQAKMSDPIIGRHEEITKVIKILLHRTKNNLILLGEPGVGKTALVKGLARRIEKGDLPSGFANVRLIELDMSVFLAGAVNREKIEERLVLILNEVKEDEAKLIFFIDQASFHVSGILDLLNLILERGQFRCIVATTLEQHKKFVDADAALERRFQQVHVAEPSAEVTISILQGLKDKYEAHYGVKIQESALEAALQLSSQYIKDRHQPEKAIDLVDEACANARVKFHIEREEIGNSPPDETIEGKIIQPNELKKENDQASKAHIPEVKTKLCEIKCKTEKGKYSKEEANAKFKLTETVGPEHIAEVVSQWINIPVISAMSLSQSEKERLNTLGERLHERVVGQSQAVDAVVEAILRSRAGLARPLQPTGSFLFLGPTGVGKTELAKALSEQLFGNKNQIVRIHLSEYVEEHSISRLIGAPPGYLGYEEGGQLTNAVRKRPYSVVLFDEVEKAHLSVLNIFLQILEDGRLTDGQGHTVDFTNTIIIMTSNLGAEHLLTGTLDKCSVQVAHDKVMEEVREHFKPEILNRIDEIVIFDPLPHDQLRTILRLQMKNVASRLAEKRIDLAVTDAALDFALTAAYDSIYGARSIRRWLERTVVTQLSKMLIREEINESSIVHVDAGPNGDNLVYRVEKKNEMPFNAPVVEQKATNGLKN